jgi:hypothetical protein
MHVAVDAATELTPPPITSHNSRRRWTERRARALVDAHGIVDVADDFGAYLQHRQHGTSEQAHG